MRCLVFEPEYRWIRGLEGACVVLPLNVTGVITRSREGACVISPLSVTSVITQGSVRCCCVWQRGRRPDGRVHRHRLDARADQTREDGGHLRPRDVPARAAQLHGADGGSVHLCARRAARGGAQRQHGDRRAQPLRPHPDADDDRPGHRADGHGARVHGECGWARGWD